MIYTPLRRIPIGEAVQRADGTYALRIKKPNKDEFDEISMDHLVAAVIKGTAQEKAHRQTDATVVLRIKEPDIGIPHRRSMRAGPTYRAQPTRALQVYRTISL